MIQVDKDTFQAEVLDASGLVLVDYYGDGCLPCEALMPDIISLSETYGDRVKFAKLNTSGARRLAISQKVLGLPTVSLYRDGAKIAELTKDDATKANIENMLVQNI